jgi:hypothetical protein
MGSNKVTWSDKWGNHDAILIDFENKRPEGDCTILTWVCPETGKIKARYLPIPNRPGEPRADD